MKNIWISKFNLQLYYVLVLSEQFVDFFIFLSKMLIPDKDYYWFL